MVEKEKEGDQTKETMSDHMTEMNGHMTEMNGHMDEEVNGHMDEETMNGHMTEETRTGHKTVGKEERYETKETGHIAEEMKSCQTEESSSHKTNHTSHTTPAGNRGSHITPISLPEMTHANSLSRQLLASLHSLLHFSRGEIILRDHSLQPLRVQTSGAFRLHQDTDDSRGSQQKIRGELKRLIRGNWWLLFATIAAKEPRELESLLRYQDACLKLSDDPRELQRIFAKNVGAFHWCEIDGKLLGGNSSLHRRYCQFTR